jgi:hypothetical protein
MVVQLGVKEEMVVIYEPTKGTPDQITAVIHETLILS